MSDTSESKPESLETANSTSAQGSAPGVPTHRDLMPRDLCRHLMFKQILNEGLDDLAGEDSVWPGDGYYWCLLTLHDIGPDDELVEPPACRRQRGCCEDLEF